MRLHNTIGSLCSIFRADYSFCYAASSTSCGKVYLSYLPHGTAVPSGLSHQQLIGFAQGRVAAYSLHVRCGAFGVQYNTVSEGLVSSVVPHILPVFGLTLHLLACLCHIQSSCCIVH